MLETTSIPASPLPRARAGEKPSLIGLSRSGLAAALAASACPSGRSRMRVAPALALALCPRRDRFRRDDQRLEGSARTRSPAHFTLTRPEIVTEQVSEDGTRKWLLRFPPRGAGRPVEIETVYIPEEGRGTLCVSSQVGCTLSCTLLPYRHAEARAQPDRRGDRRPDPGRPRPARRLSRRRAAARRVVPATAGSSPTS